MTPPDERVRARAMVALLVVLLLGQTGFNVLFNHETGEFTSAPAAGDADRFWAAIRRFTAILVAAVPTTTSTPTPASTTPTSASPRTSTASPRSRCTSCWWCSVR